MTQEQRDTLWDALEILAEQAEAHRGERRDIQTVYDKAAVALEDALNDPRS